MSSEGKFGGRSPPVVTVGSDWSDTLPTKREPGRRRGSAAV